LRDVIVQIPEKLTIQDPVSTALEGMIYFHNYLLFFFVIGVAVVWFLLEIIKRFNFTNFKTASTFTHSNVLEIV
jgi:hypothetical protein